MLGVPFPRVNRYRPNKLVKPAGVPILINNKIPRGATRIFPLAGRDYLRDILTNEGPSFEQFNQRSITAAGEGLTMTDSSQGSVGWSAAEYTSWGGPITLEWYGYTNDGWGTASGGSSGLLVLSDSVDANVGGQTESFGINAATNPSSQGAYGFINFGANVVSSGVNLPQVGFTQMILTTDGTTLKIYQNGALTGSASAAALNSNGDFVLGTDANGIWTSWQPGTVCLLSILAQACWTAQEVMDRWLDPWSFLSFPSDNFDSLLFPGWESGVIDHFTLSDTLAAVTLAATLNPIDKFTLSETLAAVTLAATLNPIEKFQLADTLAAVTAAAGLASTDKFTLTDTLAAVTLAATVIHPGVGGPKVDYPPSDYVTGMFCAPNYSYARAKRGKYSTTNS